MASQSGNIKFDIMQPATRILYLFICISTGAVALLEASSEGIEPVPVIISLICVCLAFVEDAWIISMNDGTVTHRLGLTFLAHSSRWKLEELQAVRSTRFEKGFRKTPWVRLTFEFRDGTAKVIETAPEKKIAHLIGKAEKLGDLFVQD